MTDDPPPVTPEQRPLNLALWTPANMLTLSRILIAPAVVATMVAGATGWPAGLWVCLALMVYCELSDGFDGAIARATGKVSDTGKLIDPMSDAIYRQFVFLGFVVNGWVPWWMLGVVMARDVIISYMRTFCALRGVVVQARWSGKTKALVTAIVQFLVVIVFAVQLDGGLAVPGQEIAFWAVLVAVGFTIWSLVDYLGGMAAVLRPATEPADPA